MKSIKKTFGHFKSTALTNILGGIESMEETPTVSRADNTTEQRGHIGGLRNVDPTVEPDFRCRDKYRKRPYLLESDEEIPNSLHDTLWANNAEVDYGLSINPTVNYHVSAAYSANIAGLIDGGANGGLANPKEMRLISYSSPDRYVNITGVGDLNIPRLRIGTFAAKVQLQDGRYVLMIFHEYGELKNGKTIHSKLQLRDNLCQVFDDPEHLDGKQCLITHEGYQIPLDFEQGLAYIKMQYPTEDEVKTLPCVLMTRDMPWDPSRYDKVKSTQVPTVPADPDLIPPNHHRGFNQFGEQMASAYFGGVNVEEEETLLYDASGGDYGENYGEIYGLHPEFTPGSVNLLALQTCQRRVDSTGELLPDPTDVVHCAYDLGYTPTYTTEIYSCASLVGNINVDYASQEEDKLNFVKYRKFFLNVPAETVRSTFDATTRHYRFIPSTNKLMTYKSPYPANNVYRRHELVYTDTVFSDVSAWGGIHAAQVFAGKMSRYISVHGCKTDKDFARCLEDEIRKRGAMDKLGSDRAKAEISNKVLDILRTLFIQSWQTEPHYHHQNFAERMIGELKKFTNWVIDWSDAPPESWFAAFEYVAFVMNRTAKEQLNWRTPVEALNGQTPDISSLLHFTFWEPVFIANYRKKGAKQFPSQSNEVLVRFIGFAEDIGHSATFKVFNEDTKEILYRSSLRKINPDTDVLNIPPYDPKPKNNLDDAEIEPVVQTRVPMNDIRRTAMFEPQELVGRSFLMEPKPDGTRSRAKIIGYEEEDGIEGDVDVMDAFQRDLELQEKRIKFKVKVGSTGLEEYVEWNEMCDFVEEQIQHEDDTWNFRRIMGHKRDLKAREKPQVQILWENGEVTFEPITEFYKDNPWVLAEYAKEKGLLDDWERRCPRLKLKRHAKNADKLLQGIHKAKLRSYTETPIYMFGVKVPRNHQQAVQFDEENGNRLWQEAEAKEIGQMFEYNVFEDRGHRSTAVAPDDYKLIRLHMVYACKHDGRRKARIVAGGHLTDAPLESVYSGVVSLRGIRMIIFLSELNGLDVYQTDIGNAFLEAKTTEKVYVIAGGEFGGYKDHLFIIRGSLYGLKTSSKRFHEVLNDVLRDMGFFPCVAEPDIWMRAMNADGTVMTTEELRTEDPEYLYPGISRPIFDGYYEYIASYVDDLTIGSRDPDAILDYLQDQAKFKLKGSHKIKYLLGCDYWRDENGVLCSSPKQYIDKMMDTYERLFNEKPRSYRSPLEENAHPELDTSDFCDEEETKIYQSLVGAIQWATSLGRFDVTVHVMTLSSFRARPRKGHMDMMKRFYGYLHRMKSGTIRYRTEMPDLSDLEIQEYDWSRTVYAGSTEEYPKNLPAARGNPVQQLSYVDANLYHDMLSGKAVTALLHMLNQTPIDWFSRKQDTVETATFGSENVAARKGIEQMKDIKFTLLYLGVPVIDRSIMVGDNKSVVDCATQPHSRLAKRHLMLSYHYVREAIATGNYAYVWLNGKDNPADILSKHWSYGSVWQLLQPLLFWEGDTLECPDKLIPQRT